MTKPKKIIDTTRRHLLTIAAGGAVAAAIPDARAYPGHAADPIYAAIEAHRKAAAAWDAAVGVRASFPEGPEPRTDEQWEELDRLDDAEAAAREPLAAAGVDLVTTAPTSLAGIVAAVSYVRAQMRNDAFMPWEIEFEFEYDEGCPGDAQETMGWIDAFLDTIADGRGRARRAGAIMTKRKVSKIVASTTAHTGADPREFFDPVLPVIDAHRKRVEIVLEAVRVEGESFGKGTEAAQARLKKTMRAVWASLDPPARTGDDATDNAAWRGRVAAISDDAIR
ncbi:hypothetical protein SAMN05443247_10548 [Bradyrhizobium erythrophlei]|nr:hypothetical protein SAMN05443247_10548 [Bradyrhizobium erythrophlei]